MIDHVRYNDALNTGLKANWFLLNNLTGCAPKCTLRSYHLKEENVRNATFKRDWYAAFNLDVKSSGYKSEQEFLNYDIWDLTSGLGGLLGLFIGTSFLGIIFTLVETVGKLGILAKSRNTIFE